MKNCIAVHACCPHKCIYHKLIYLNSQQAGVVVNQFNQPVQVDGTVASSGVETSMVALRVVVGPNVASINAPHRWLPLCVALRIWDPVPHHVVQKGPQSSASQVVDMQPDDVKGPDDVFSRQQRQGEDGLDRPLGSSVAGVLPLQSQGLYLKVNKKKYSFNSIQSLLIYSFNRHENKTSYMYDVLKSI